MKFLLKIFLTVLLMSACHSIEDQTKDQSVELKEEAVNTLRKVLHEQQEWVKVHAAEFLIWTGNDQDVKSVFLKELEQYAGKPQYRIGIWRVLSQLGLGDEAARYKTQIANAFLDTAGKDRIHAAETLGKLKVSPFAMDEGKTIAALNSEVEALQAYTNWAIAYTDDNSMAKARSYFLSNIANPGADIVLRKISAYVLRYIGGVDGTAWNTLADDALNMNEDADGRINFLTTAVILAGEQNVRTGKYQQLRNVLLANAETNSKAVRIEIANALVIKGTEADLSLLQQWLRNESPIGVAADDADVQASAAYAILKICERAPVNNQPE
ncbi:MAG: HEAT repeat domain-containing protein [Chitinophagaceae bacterium]|nr:HEAT repeat domain-containing protein [Chitinophagaceae bacterium]